jgi:excisionase family DNA binding protein
MDSLLRPEEAAAALRVSRGKVMAMLKAGDIPSVRVGARLRIRADALRAWIEHQDSRVADAASAEAYDLHRPAHE